MDTESLTEEDEKSKSIKKLKKKQEEYLNKIMLLVSPVVKSWYLKLSLRYVNEKQLKECDEEILADYTDYVTENLDELIKKKGYLERKS